MQPRCEGRKKHNTSWYTSWHLLIKPPSFAPAYVYVYNRGTGSGSCLHERSTSCGGVVPWSELDLVTIHSILQKCDFEKTLVTGAPFDEEGLQALHQSVPTYPSHPNFLRVRQQHQHQVQRQTLKEAPTLSHVTQRPPQAPPWALDPLIMWKTSSFLFLRQVLQSLELNLTQLGA